MNSNYEKNRSNLSINSDLQHLREKSVDSSNIVIIENLPIPNFKNNFGHRSRNIKF